MKITIEQLREIIKEEVEIAEASTKKSEKAPKAFSEFRKLVAAAAEKSGAPKSFVEEVKDGIESGVEAALANSWRNVEHELGSIDEDGSWGEMVAYYAHDAIINAAAQHFTDKFDARKVAVDVEEEIKKMGPQPEEKSVPMIPGDVNAFAVAKKIADALEAMKSKVKVSGSEDEALLISRQEVPANEILDSVKDLLVNKMNATILRVTKDVHQYEIPASEGSAVAYIQVIDADDIDSADPRRVEVRVFTDM